MTAAPGGAPAREAPGARPGRRRWTMRRRLVVVLLALTAAVAAVMGVVSTLALRDSLLGQIDDRLVAASARARSAPDRIDGPGRAPAPDDGSPDPGSPAPTWPEDRERLPPSLRLPGQQDVGSLSYFEQGGQVVAGYFDDSGDFQPLSAEQQDVLAEAPLDGEPVSVTLPGLGGYRVIGTTAPGGEVVVTGLSIRDAATTVERYVMVEVGVALLGLLIAGCAGWWLVGRELRPLNRVAATATRVAELPLSRGEVTLAERVPDADTDPSTEVGRVGAAFNQMLGHVGAALAARQESETQVRRFVADASHELRTPLASIRGYAELVRRLPDELPPDALRAMSRVESESQRMTALVEDMLLLARLDAGRDLEHHEVDVAALAVDAVADAHAASRDHVWRLDLDEAGATPPIVRGDEDRLRQVLVNLLSNAREHTPAGTTVVLGVHAAAGQVRVTVRDDGPGIEEPLRSRLFQRFTRGDASRNHASGSTGLGLAIAHAVVLAHGGSIEVDGTPGATTFTVTLPALTTPDLAPPEDA
ncbi:sensor histidine kinase [Cellulomonas chengniuliangii]|uniref:histidine kinase n=1 Tax=Cellulomonas chengniuliangii TaxID=2968084 RepID=A0ABY5KZC5_9CELL|nr:HAMP domain-containing sensor histidine kinase [Cellulomonas chengniuliangii]MCC2307438.1 HAMP domain-containing histidine kinase [Cellulomonas chengniuliangii]UUI75784.1 HAMP domain-containing histidine kinase [Cellulomonas chengniuliangii]